ncbi:MAG: hypothetical protein WA087_02305 [Candidatus Saccharimonadales bacterium]
MTQYLHEKEKGSVKSWMISTISLIVVVVGLIVLSAWLYMQFIEKKTDVDGQIESAVVTAKKEQADDDATKFAEKEKEPNRTFVGPDDYGSVSFNYPKTWGAYVNKDASNGGIYEAYLNPKVVPPVSASRQFALRVTIEEKDYDKVIAGYESKVEKGELKSSSVKVDNSSGVRLSGAFSDDIRGYAVIFKIRDKTLTIRTDANTFKKDFDALVKTIKFVK